MILHIMPDIPLDNATTLIPFGSASSFPLKYIFEASYNGKYIEWKIGVVNRVIAYPQKNPGTPSSHQILQNAASADL